MKKKSRAGKKIIHTFMPKEYKKIPSGKLWDFVGPIVTSKDRKILRSWQNHFEELKIPYRIIEYEHLRIKNDRPKEVCEVRELWCEKLA